MVRFKLNHNCGMPGCVGMPGDIIEITDDQANLLVSRGGGEILRDLAEKRPGKPADKLPVRLPVSKLPETPATAGEPPVKTVSLPIESLELDLDLQELVVSAGFETIESLTALEDKTSIKGVGPAKAKEINAALEKWQSESEDSATTETESETTATTPDSDDSE